MELKQYAHIVWKRVYIPVTLVIVVVIASLLNRQPAATTAYGMTMRFNVAVVPEMADNEYSYNGLHAWVTSEYMADTLSVLVQGQEFAADVNRHLAAMDSPAAVSAGSIASEIQHRVITLNLSWPNPEELAQIAEAISQTMKEDIAAYFPQVNTQAVITQVDASGPAPINAVSLTQRLDIPIRLTLALVAGIALTFLLDYLDDSVRGKAELETMGISVLAEVPREK